MTITRILIAAALVYLLGLLSNVNRPANAQDAMSMTNQIVTQQLINQASGVYDNPRAATKPTAPAQQVIVVPAGAKVYYDGKEIQPLAGAGSVPKPNPYTVKRICVRGPVDNCDEFIIRLVDREVGQACYRHSKDVKWTCGPIPPGK